MRKRKDARAAGRLRQWCLSFRRVNAKPANVLGCNRRTLITPIAGRDRPDQRLGRAESGPARRATPEGALTVRLGGRDRPDQRLGRAEWASPRAGQLNKASLTVNLGGR